ncbi:MAG: B12-binding domain-containing radical SAM protein [Candidatus Marinimicrobia bacterium]|nr:B12-binding domain-containing radical SAM protein [Candidatus Neomarinimicrobiota bacterium]
MSPKILLVNPWIADFAAYDLWAKPIGLLYIGKFLREYGYKISLVDLQDRKEWDSEPETGKYIHSGRGKYKKTRIEKPDILKPIPRHYGLYGATPEQFKNELQSHSPDAILVTSQMTYWYPGVQKTVAILRKKFPETPLVLGGIYATLCSEHASKVINPDHLVTGTGEKQVLKLLDAMFDINRDYATIPDFNDEGLLPWDLYEDLDAVGLMTSRGCPYTCSFCATNQLHPHFHMRQPEDVIREIIYVYDKYNVKNFAFYDDALFTNKEQHIKPILKTLINRGLGINFHTPNGLFAREIDSELAKLMKRAGFKTVRLSLESSVKKWQKEASSKVSRQDFQNAIYKLKKAGYQSREIEAYLIMGLPGQKPEEVQESLDFVYKSEAISRLAAFTPIPGTKDWQRAIDNNYIKEDIDPLLTNNTVYPCASSDFPAEKYQELRHYSNQLNNKVREKNG